MEELKEVETNSNTAVMLVIVVGSLANDSFALVGNYDDMNHSKGDMVVTMAGADLLEYLDFHFLHYFDCQCQHYL